MRKNTFDKLKSTMAILLSGALILPMQTAPAIASSIPQESVPDVGSLEDGNTSTDDGENPTNTADDNPLRLGTDFMMPFGERASESGLKVDIGWVDSGISGWEKSEDGFHLSWSSDKTETRTAEMNVYYEDRDCSARYKAGDIKIRVPMLSQLDDAQISADSGLANFKHIFRWQPVQIEGVDYVELTNNNDIAAGTNFSGFVNIIWEFNNRYVGPCRKDVEVSGEVKNGESGEMSALECGTSLGIRIDTVKDAFSPKLSASKISAIDDMPSNWRDYIWVNYTFNPHQSMKSMGLTRASYSFEVPDNCLVYNNALGDREASSQQYRVEVKSADKPENQMFAIGWPKSEYEGKSATITGIMNGTYRNGDALDSSISQHVFTIPNLSAADYDFAYSGNKFGISKNFEEAETNTNVLQGVGSSSGLASQVSAIGKAFPDETYTYEIYDDFQDITTNKNGYRALQPSETGYDVVYAPEKILDSSGKPRPDSNDMNGKVYTVDENGIDAYVGELKGISIGHNNFIDIPENSYGVKIVYENVSGYVQFSDILVGTRYFVPENRFDWGSTSSNPGISPVNGRVRNVAGLMVRDNAGNLVNEPSRSSYTGEQADYTASRDENRYGHYVQRAYAEIPYHEYRDAKVTFYQELSTQASDSDAKGGTEYFEHSLRTSWTAHGQWNGDNTDIPHYDELVVGVLLPRGWESVGQTGLIRPSIANGRPVYRTVIDNYNKTGRTMVVYKVDASQKNYESWPEYNDSFTVYTPVRIPVDLWFEYGNRYTFDSYSLVREASGTMSEVPNPDGGSGRDTLDLDGDGLTSDILAHSATTFSMNTAMGAHLELRERVASEDTGGVWKDSTQILLGKEYKYKLSFRTAASETTDIVFYDTLEDGSDWKGRLTGIDVSALENTGYHPVVYLSSDSSAPNNIKSSRWKKQEDFLTEHTYSDVVRIAVALEGDSVPANSYVKAELLMLSSEDDGDIGGKARDSFTVAYKDVDRVSRSIDSSSVEVLLADGFGKIRIDKTDASTGVPIAGAKFDVVNGNGTKILANVSTGTYDMPTGTYSVIETSSPMGYNLDSSPHEVEISADTVAIVEIANARNTGTLQVVKTDASNGMPMEGIEFELKNAEGNVIGAQTTNEQGKASFFGLDWGNYIVHEKNVPDGYKAMPDKFVSINSSNAKGIVPVVVEAKNERQTGTLDITKTDYVTGEPVSGAVFELSGNHRTVSLTTNEEGKASCVGIAWGVQYILTEKSAPEGYIVDPSPREFMLSKESCNVPISFEIVNEPILGTIKIVKEDQDSHERLAGAEFTLSKDGTVVRTGIVTDENGEALIKDLTWGNYSIQESMPPAGYAWDTQSKSVAITSNNCNQTIEVPWSNKSLYGDLTVYKYDESYSYNAGDDGKPWLYQQKKLLSGATLVLTNESTGDSFTIVTQNTEPSVLAHIPYGRYSVSETSSPLGFGRLDKDIKFNFTSQNNEIGIGNEPSSITVTANKNIPTSFDLYKLERDAGTGETEEEFRESWAQLHQGIINSPSYLTIEGTYCKKLLPDSLESDAIFIVARHKASYETYDQLVSYNKPIITGTNIWMSPSDFSDVRYVGERSLINGDDVTFSDSASPSTTTIFSLGSFLDSFIQSNPQYTDAPIYVVYTKSTAVMPLPFYTQSELESLPTYDSIIDQYRKDVFDSHVYSYSYVEEDGAKHWMTLSHVANAKTVKKSSTNTASFPGISQGEYVLLERTLPKYTSRFSNWESGGGVQGPIGSLSSFGVPIDLMAAGGPSEYGTAKLPVMSAPFEITQDDIDFGSFFIGDLENNVQDIEFNIVKKGKTSSGDLIDLDSSKASWSWYSKAYMEADSSMTGGYHPRYSSMSSYKEGSFTGSRKLTVPFTSICLENKKQATSPAANGFNNTNIARRLIIREDSSPDAYNWRSTYKTDEEYRLGYAGEQRSASIKLTVKLRGNDITDDEVLYDASVPESVPPLRFDSCGYTIIDDIGEHYVETKHFDNVQTIVNSSANMYSGSGYSSGGLLQALHPSYFYYSSPIDLTFIDHEIPHVDVDFHTNILKVDADDHSKTLPGAKFSVCLGFLYENGKVEEGDIQDNGFGYIDGTTNSDGRIQGLVNHPTVISDIVKDKYYTKVDPDGGPDNPTIDVPEGIFPEKAVYYILFRETSAPSGYSITKSDVKFLIHDSLHTNMSDSEKQQWALDNGFTLQTSEDVLVENKKLKSTVSFYKINASTKFPMSGVEFDLQRKSATTWDSIGEYVSDANGLVSAVIDEIGDYRFVENPPAGFEKADNLTFSVSESTIGKNLTLGQVENFPKTGTIKIRKIDSDTGTPIPGAMFALYDWNGALVDSSSETDAQGYAYFDNMPLTMGDNKYYIAETYTPDGYYIDPDSTIGVPNIPSSEKIVAECSLTSEGASLQIENSPIPVPPTLTIHKLASDNHDEALANCVFDVRDASGKIVASKLTTNDSGNATAILPKGTYTIVETEACPGFDKAAPFEVLLDEDLTVDVFNDPKPKSLSVLKTDSNTHKPVSDAIFSLMETQEETYQVPAVARTISGLGSPSYAWTKNTAVMNDVNESDKIALRGRGDSGSTSGTSYTFGPITVDKSGTISAKAVVIGKEYKAGPRAYGHVYFDSYNSTDSQSYTTTTVDITSVEAENTNVFSMDYLKEYSFHVQPGKYRIRYQITPMSAATYNWDQLYSTTPIFASDETTSATRWGSPQEVAEAATAHDGIASFGYNDYKPNALYSVKEKQAPYGYKLDEQTYDVEFSRSSPQVVMNIEDEPYLGSVILTKTFDEETSPSLSQAVSFDLYNADTQEKLQSELKLNDDSKLNIMNLHYGNYFLRETSTAPGYILADDLHFTIDSENELELSLDNRSPSTNIRVHKICDDTSDPIAGAEFTLKRTDIEPHVAVQNGVTDENGNLVFENVPIAHTYELEETKVPDGFIAKETTTPVPQLTQKDLDITVLNYIPNADIKITKIDSETNEPLQGATFELRRKISPEIIGYEKAYKVQSGPTWGTSNLSSSGGVNSTRLYTKNSSPISVPGAEYLDVNVKYGTYNSWSYGAIGKGSQTNVSASSLNNTISSRLYTSHSSSSTYRNFSTATYRVTGDTVSPAFYAYSSSPYYYGYGMYVSLTGYIPYDDTTKPIYSPDYEVVATAITDENGVCEFKNMNQFYDYYVMETNPPEGYASKQDKYDITLDENHFAELSIENDFLGDVNVIKTDKEDGTALSGARFGLYKVFKSNLYHKTYSTSTNYSGSTNSSYDWSSIVSNGKTYYRSSSYVQSLSTSRRNVTFTIPEGETGIVSFDAGANIDESVVKASDYSAWFSLTNTSTNQRLVYRNMFDTVPEFYDSASRAIQKTGALYSYELPSGAYTLTFNWQCGTGTSNSARANSFLWYGNLEVISATGSESGTPNLSEPRYILMQNKLTGADGTVRFIPDSTDYEYVVMEMRAPAGYDIDRTIHPVIFNTQKHAYVSAENERATGYLNAAKYSNSARTQTLSGAMFNLYDDAGNLIASGITSNSSGILEPAIELPFGTYYLEETQAPQGYKLPKTRTEYIVNSVNTNLKSIYNARVDGTATVHKTDAEGNPLAGAEFTVEARLRDSSRDPLLWVTIGTGVTDETGTAEITGINRDHITHSSYFYGYRIYETKPPAGYASDGVSSAQSVAFDELTGKATQELTFTNEPAPMGVEIHKVDSRSNDIPVQGAKFEIHNAETKELVAESDYTDSDGIANVFGLPWGDYYLVETETGSYYTVDPTPKPFTLGPDTAAVFKDSKWYTTMYVPNRTLLPSWEEPPRHLYITKNIGDPSILDIAPSTFIFKVTGTDGTALYETISFDGSNETSKTVDVGLDSDVRYTVEEVKSLRWNTSQVSSTTAIIEGDKAIVPEDMEESTVVFENEVSDYHGYTGDDSKVNHVGNQQKATLVNLTARTVGSLNSLDNLPHFVVKAYYSDGTSKDVSSEAGIEYAENIRYGDYTMPVNISYGGLEITLKLHASIAPKPYKVEYYYDGVIDDSKTKSISLAAKKVGTEIAYDASKDVAPLTYSLDRIDNQTFIVSDDPSSAQQVVKLFYVSDGHYTDEAIEGQSTFFNKPVSMVPSKNFSYFETPVNTVENDTTWSYYADSEYYKHYQWNTVPTLRLLFGVSETRAFSMEGYYGSYSNASEPGTMKLYKWDGEKYVEVEGITPSKSGSSTLSAIVEPGYYLVEVSTARANGYGEYWNLPKLEEPAYIDIETSIDGERASEYDKQHVAIFPDTEYSYANIQYDGQPSEDMFKCTSCVPETLNLVPGESVAVKLGYSTKTSYTVNYYFNNELDRSETQTVSGLYNDTVSVTPKTFAQCTFTSMDRDSIVLTKDPAENVINLYYDWDVTASTLYGLVSHDSEMNYELTLQHLRKAPPTASILPDGTLLDAVYVAGSYTSESAVPWRSSYSTRIKKVSIPRTIVVPSLQYYFAYMTSLVELDLTNLNFSRLTNLTRAFYQCSKIKTIYAPEGTDWGATHSTGSYAFSGCSSLVGGNGTKYKSTSSYDYSYACIDNLNGKLGYFTAGNKTCNIEIYKDGVLSETQQQVASAIPGTSLNITIPDIPNYVLVDTSPSDLKYSDGLEKITLSYASEDKYNTTVPVSIEFYQDGSKHREESMSLPYGSIFTYSVTGQEIPNCKLISPTRQTIIVSDSSDVIRYEYSTTYKYTVNYYIDGILSAENVYESDNIYTLGDTATYIAPFAYKNSVLEDQSKTSFECVIGKNDNVINCYYVSWDPTQFFGDAPQIGSTVPTANVATEAAVHVGNGTNPFYYNTSVANESYYQYRRKDTTIASDGTSKLNFRVNTTSKYKFYFKYYLKSANTVLKASLYRWDGNYWEFYNTTAVSTPTVGSISTTSLEIPDAGYWCVSFEENSAANEYAVIYPKSFQIKL